MREDDERIYPLHPPTHTHTHPSPTWPSQSMAEITDLPNTDRPVVCLIKQMVNFPNKAVWSGVPALRQPVLAPSPPITPPISRHQRQACQDATVPELGMCSAYTVHTLGRACSTMLPAAAKGVVHNTQSPLAEGWLVMPIYGRCIMICSSTACIHLGSPIYKRFTLFYSILYSIILYSIPIAVLWTAILFTYIKMDNCHINILPASVCISI